MQSTKMHQGLIYRFTIWWWGNQYQIISLVMLQITMMPSQLYLSQQWETN